MVRQEAGGVFRARITFLKGTASQTPVLVVKDTLVFYRGARSPGVAGAGLGKACVCLMEAGSPNHK